MLHGERTGADCGSAQTEARRKHETNSCKKMVWPWWKKKKVSESEPKTEPCGTPLVASSFFNYHWCEYEDRKLCRDDFLSDSGSDSNIVLIMTFYSFSGALFFNYWVDLLSGTAAIHLTCWQFDRCRKNRESSSSALTRGLNVIKEAAEKGRDGEQTRSSHLTAGLDAAWTSIASRKITHVLAGPELEAIISTFM